MTPLSSRDRRALVALALAVVLFAAIWFWPSSGDSAAQIPVSASQAERRLKRLRRLVGAVPGRQETAKRFDAEIARREQGLISAETAAQAQAQLVQIVRRVAQAQTPPLDFRGAEFAPIKPFGSAYGEAAVTISTECGIDQLLNFLADLGSQPELIASSNLQLGQANPKKKTVPARLTITGIVPGKLVPAKKGGSAF